MRRIISLCLLTSMLTVWPGHAAAIERFHQLAELWGLEPIESVELDGDDIELRFWATGFGPKGYILSRRDGRWTAFHLGENRTTVVAAFHGYRAARVEPLCNLDAAFEELEALGVRSLAPPKRHPTCQLRPDGQCLDQISIDGWTAYIELKTSAGLISQRYPRPGIPVFAEENDDPRAYPSYRAQQMYRLLDHTLGGRAVVVFEPHSRSFTPPAVVLTRATYMPGVQAVLVHHYDADSEGGTLHYESQYFREYPQGFFAVVNEDRDSTVRMSWQGFRRVLIGHGNEAFRLERDGDRVRAALNYESAAAVRPRELAIKEVASFRDLNFVDLTSGFERKLHESSSMRACRRVQRLAPTTPNAPVWEVTVDSELSDHTGWFVAPPALEGLKLIKVRNNLDDHWIGVPDPGRYSVNQRVTVSQRIVPPPPGSDKALLLLEPLPVPPGR